MKRNKNEPVGEVEAFCLDSFIVNGNVDLAYTQCHKSKAKENYTHVLALRWLKSDAVKAYLNQRRGEVLFVGGKSATEKESLKVDFSQRGNLIRALSDAANNEGDNVRRAAILKQIADLQRMKQDENKDEADLIHFYLPLKCHYCELYMNNQTKK